MNFAALMASADKAVRETLGQPITYTPPGGGSVVVSGIFDAAYVRLDLGNAGASSCGPAVFLTLTDLPTDPSEEYPGITAGGVEYTVHEAQPDGLGTVLLLLHRA